jgi:hypothetical protein
MRPFVLCCVVGFIAGSYSTKEFDFNWARGQYRIGSRFVGTGAMSINSDTPGIGLMNFWKGILRSNSIVFQVP